MAHGLTDTDVGDITAVPGLLATVEGSIASVIADGAYDGASVYRAASLHQRDPPADIVIPPRASSIISTNDTGALTVRDRHVRYIAETGRMAWQEATGYGRRSLVETVIGRYKHVIGANLWGRTFGGQQGEVAIAVSVLNRMTRRAKTVSVEHSDATLGWGVTTLKADPRNNAAWLCSV